MPRYDQEKMVKLTSELRKSQARLAALSAMPRDDFKRFLDALAVFLEWQTLPGS
jgi:hypothetical protein